MSEMVINEYSDPFDDKGDLEIQCDKTDIVRLPKKRSHNRLDRRILSLLQKFPNNSSH